MAKEGTSHRYDILEAIGQIARDKNVTREVVAETIKTGLLSAAKKRFGSSDHVVVEVDLDTGNIEMRAEWRVVDEVLDPGIELTIEEAKEIDSKAELFSTVTEYLPFEEFGRHAIHSAKQSLVQKVREAEHDRIYDDYSQRINEVVTGTVQQVLKGDIYITLGRAEAILPSRHQIRRERFYQGNTVRALIFDVLRESKGPQIVLSRTDSKFLANLFELEVPEIYEGIVEVKGVARRPGERSKVSVSSSDPRVDAVGACVGIKGSRVQSIVKELNNERIDIIEYSEDISTYLARALSPAPVIRVEIDRANGKLTAIVEDDQLSLAIGKNGINAELASHLTGLNVDIIAQSDYVKREADKAKEAGLLIDLDGIGEKMVYKLNSSGIHSIRDLADASDTVLTQVEGVGRKTAEKMIKLARDYFEQREVADAGDEPDEDVDEYDESDTIDNMSDETAHIESDDDSVEA